jgi:hypothetical protein
MMLVLVLKILRWSFDATNPLNANHTLNACNAINAQTRKRVP